MTPEQLTRIYIEIGALGLICVIMVIVFVLLVKTMIDSNKDNRDFIKKVLTTEQSKSEDLVKQIVTQVTTHIPSAEETKNLNKLSETIDEQLYTFMQKVHASRVVLIQYHNGTRGFSKHSFMKMSCTNEAHQSNVKPLTPMFQDQMKSLFNKSLIKLDEEGEYIVDDVEKIKDYDESMYWFMNERNDKQAFHVSVKNKEGNPIGYLLAIYSNNNSVTANTEEVMPELKALKNLIEFLMQSNS